MTSISALSSAPYVLANSTGGVNSPRPVASDFQSQLKTQSNPSLQLPDPAIMQVVSESTMDMTRRPEVEAMLQMLASRKVALNAPSKVGRSVPGVLASGLDVPDYSFAAHTILDCAEIINFTSADEDIVLYPKPMQDPNARGADSCGSNLIAGVPGASCDSGLNATAIAIALSGTILIWLPSEIVRAPMLSPRIRIWRPRKLVSADGHQPDQSDADFDKTNE